MQASCFEDHEWARWSIWYLGINKFKCPAVWCLKHNLYDLIAEQKKVKIDLYEALLDYCQLSSIEKDDLFLEGFDREFQNDPWPTCQVTQEAERLLKKGYRLELREACIMRDQQRAREVWYEARVQESKAMRAEEQCRGMEKILRSSQKHQEKARENPPIEPRYAQDEPRMDEQPVKGVAHALKVWKPTLESRDDLCEVPEQVRHTEVEEIESGVEGGGSEEATRRGEKMKKNPKISYLEDKGDLTRVLDNSLQHLSYESENCILEGYESYGDKVQCSEGQGSPLWWVEDYSQVYSNFQHLKTNQEGGLKCQDTADTVHEEADTSLFRRRGLKVARRPLLLTYGSYTLGYMECYIKFQGYKAGDRAKVKPRAPLGTRDKT
ncbi:hypothetical protein F5141DRAFT_1064024 [Pisolithus sp. B1]|nr:hypothetical protein F5141DRAFT_1064024 [Pisolithus sp. B1]